MHDYTVISLQASSLHSFVIELQTKVVIGSTLERARVPNNLLNLLDWDQPLNHFHETYRPPSCFVSIAQPFVFAPYVVSF